MAFKKYINIREVAELTGVSNEEIRSLANTGVLPAHKARRGHWRLNTDAVEKYFGVQINKPTIEVEEPMSIDDSSNETLLILNESHYQEIIDRICSAKSSIRIMTANFRRFNLKPTCSQGKDYDDGTPFIKYLMAKAVQGVSVQIICSMPSSSFTEEWKEYYRQMAGPKLFKYKFCDRNHAKVVIIDNKLAYDGSANVTPAGLGQGIFTPGNFEAGIMTDNPEVISLLNTLFSKIMNGGYCTNCHRAKKCKK